jgi:hypothetical protein
VKRWCVACLTAHAEHREDAETCLQCERVEQNLKQGHARQYVDGWFRDHPLRTFKLQEQARE